MKDLEIRKVKNGYFVVPPYGNTGHIRSGDEVHVFETFKGLVSFLGDNFEETPALAVVASEKPNASE